MNEKLKNAILENEDLLEQLLAIHFNNITANEEETEDFNITEYLKGNFSEPFKDAFYIDIDYYIELLNKWKNSNAIDKLNEALKENSIEYTEEELKEAKEKYEELAEAEKGLYKDELTFLENNLNINFLNKAYFVFYDAGLSGCLIILFAISKLFYTINKYKDTPIAEELRNYLKEVINEKEVNTTNKDIIEKITNEDKDFNAFYHNVNIGIAFSEIMLTASRGSYFAKNILDETTLNYRENKSNILEDLGAKSKEPKEVVADYLLELKNFKRLDELFNTVANEIGLYISEVLERNNLTLETAYTVEDDEEIRKLTTNIINELDTTSLEDRERTKNFKNYAVRRVVSFLALDTTTKKLATSLEAKETMERRRKEAYKSFNDLEPVGTKYVMSAVNPYSTAIKSLHSRIATYNENNIEVKERTLESINKKIELLEAKDILTDAEIKDLDKLLKEQEAKEKDINETRKRHKKIEEEIEIYKKEVMNLTNELAEIGNKGLSEREKRLEKRKITNSIKKLSLKISMLEKAKGSRGLYLQLAQEEDRTLLTAKEEFKGGGSLTMFVENTLEGLSKYNREALNLLRYLDGLAYNLPFEKYKREDIPILIDLDNYVEETGRKATAYKSVKDQLIDAVELLQKEYFRVGGQVSKYNLDIEKGKIEIIGDYYVIAPKEEYKGTANTTNKTTVLLFLGHTYKQILFNEKMMQWASVPKLLMRLTDKEIKEEGYTIKKELVQDLGFYIYEEIRRNINEKSKDTKGQFKGYYQLTRYFKTIVEHLQKSNALASNKSNTYVKRIIKPLEEAFTYLADLGLVEIQTKAFSIYYGDEELGEKGLKKAKASTIKKAFEDAKITIIFKVINKEAYDKILENKLKYRTRGKRTKTKKEIEEAKLLTLFEDADFIEK